MKKKITIALVMIFAVLAYITCASQVLDANAEGMSVTMGGKTLETGYYWYVGNQLQDVLQTAPDAAVTPDYIHYDASTGIMTVYGNFSTEDMSGIQIDGGTLILSGAGNLTIVSDVDRTAAITGANGAGIRTEGFSGEINIGVTRNACAICGLTTVALETTSDNGIVIVTSQLSGVFIDAENVSLKGPNITFNSQAASLSGIIRATGDISLVSDEDISIVNDCSGAMFTGSNVTLESTAGEINLENTTSGIATGNLTMSAARNINIEAKDAVANGNLNITKGWDVDIISNHAVTVGGNISINHVMYTEIQSGTNSVCGGDATIYSGKNMQLTGNGDYPVVAGALTVNPDADANIVLRMNSGSTKYSSPFVGTYPAEGMVRFMESDSSQANIFAVFTYIDGVKYDMLSPNCEHPFVYDNGMCMLCGASNVPIAKLTKSNGTEVDYTSLPDAVTAAENGDTVTLLHNCDARVITLNHYTELSNKKIIIDLGGHKLQIQEIDTERALTIQNGTFYGSINHGANDGKLLLKNLKGKIGDLQWMPNDGVWLENSQLSTSGNQFSVEKLSLDENSVLSIKNTGITNYGTQRFPNVEDALGGIKEFLPYGYKLAQRKPFSGAQDTYNTVVDENGAFARNILLKYKQLTDPEAEITVDTSSVVYDGTSKVPAVTVSYDGVVLAANRNYSVTYNNNVNVGTATIHIKGIGVYHDSVDKTFVIGKANQAAPTGLVPTAETIDGKNDGKIANLSLKMEYSVDNRTWIDANTEVLTNLPDGDYYVRFKETANYYASPSTKVVVAKGVAPSTTGGQTTTEGTTTTENQTTGERATTQQTFVEQPDGATTQAGAPKTTETSKKTDKAVSTGDAYPIAIMITLMLGAGVGITGMIRRRKEK